MGLSWYEPRRGMGSGGVFLGMWHGVGGHPGEPGGTERQSELLAFQVSVSAKPGFDTCFCHFHAGET